MFFLCPWRVLTLMVSLLTVIPLLIILSSVLTPDWEVWQHLVEYALPELLLNTLYLIFGVGTGVLLLGVPLAWLTAVHDFTGRRFFSWALMLPLAIPAYVLAFTQLGLFDFTGPVQTWLRTHFGDASWAPNIYTTPSVLLVMSLAFYPYVYLLARNAFSTMGRRALEVGQSLGLSPWQSFRRVVLPLARPWIIGGLMLALMETVADFGTVAIFNFDTFTSAIYKAWFALFSLSAAKQLASLLVIIVLLLLWFEQRSRGRRNYCATGKTAPQPRLRLHGGKNFSAVLVCSLVLFLGFILPVAQLLIWASRHLKTELDETFISNLTSSIVLSLSASLLVIAIALLIGYAKRRDNQCWNRTWIQLATLGYAVPGTVLAVGIFLPVAWLDNLLLQLFPNLLPPGTTTILKGTLLIVLIGYVARFLAVGYSTIDAAMHRITRSQEEAARNMGYRGLRLLAHLHLPLIRGGLFTALLMVFIDVMKEMPITLMTRPYGWDTLAVRIFNLTTEGEWERAALPAIALILVSLLPVLVLSRQSETQ